MYARLANINQNKVGVVFLTSNEVDLWAENITSEKESNFIVIKGLIHQKNIEILNLYEFNYKAAVQT